MKLFAITQPGIGPIAELEIRMKFPETRGFAVHNVRNGTLVEFESSSSPRDLLTLRTTEDIYASVGSIRLKSQTGDLDSVKSWLMVSNQLEPVLSAHRSVKGTTTRRTTYRVITQTKRDPHPYRRIDLQKTIEGVILERYNRKWKLVEEGEDIEFWAVISDNVLTLGVRLSDSTMRHRTYKVAHIPASLRPTVAAALVFLSEPSPSDVFLDPMAGAGTILIERANAGRYVQIYGGDIREEALSVMKQNIGNKYKPIDVRQWDATNLPLTTGTVSKLVCNLPFGKQIGTHESNIPLYKKAFKEFSRVLETGGLMVLLTSEDKLIKDTLGQTPSLHLVKTYAPVVVLGMNAAIYIIGKDGDN
jgi:tRNA (guanine6-N2)-methyltransferase